MITDTQLMALSMWSSTTDAPVGVSALQHRLDVLDGCEFLGVDDIEFIIVVHFVSDQKRCTQCFINEITQSSQDEVLNFTLLRLSKNGVGHVWLCLVDY